MKMEIKNIKYEEIKPYWRNPRKNEDTIPHLIESIKKFGFLVPITIDEGNVIVTGHTRYKAIGELMGRLTEKIDELKKQKGKEKLIENLEGINKGIVPVIYVQDLTESQIREYRIADNKITELSTWDYDSLETELKTLGGAIGFNLNELTKLIGEGNVDFESYTPEDIEKTKKDLDDHFNKLYEQSEEYIDLICPKCGEEFQIKRSELKGNTQRHLTK